MADHLGIAKRTVARRAKRGRWQERLADIEREARQRTDAKAVETIEQMAERHLKLLRAVQGRSLEALKRYPLTSAMEAVRALDMSIKQERVIRGEPGEHVATSMEDVYRDEIRRWAEPVPESER